jgi:hypothetical protein
MMIPFPYDSRPAEPALARIGRLQRSYQHIDESPGSIILVCGRELRLVEVIVEEIVAHLRDNRTVINISICSALPKPSRLGLKASKSEFNLSIMKHIGTSCLIAPLE